VRIRKAPEKGGSLSDLAWYAIHCRSNQETQVRDALRGQALEEFLPSYEFTRDGEIMLRPLFSGYLFARFDCVHRLPILQISGLLSILGNHTGPMAIANTEVEQIRRLCAAPATVAPHARMTKGQKVRIKYGPMIGSVGIVQYQQGKCRVIVDVAMFGRAVAVQVERESLELL
jgi:transcription antitermination factor NusG